MEGPGWAGSFGSRALLGDGGFEDPGWALGSRMTGFAHVADFSSMDGIWCNSTY